MSDDGKSNITIEGGDDWTAEDLSELITNFYILYNRISVLRSQRYRTAGGLASQLSASKARVSVNEKLVIDAEAIGMIKRMLKGIQVHTETLAIEMFDGIEFRSDFIKQKITKRLLRQEQYMPSNIVDRTSLRARQEQGNYDTFDRAKERVLEIISQYELPDRDHGKVKELKNLV